jgi:hypothetical protein
MILRLLCIWLVFYSLLSSLMHGTMNPKFETGEQVHGTFVCDQRKSGLFGAEVIINLVILPWLS